MPVNRSIGIIPQRFSAEGLINGKKMYPVLFGVKGRKFLALEKNNVSLIQ